MSDRQRLDHMLEAIRRIEHTVGDDRSAFEASIDKQDAVLYRLQIIGEAASRLSAEIRDAHAELPWKEIIGLRHVLVHGYDIVDLDRIWHIIEHRLPELREQLASITPDAQ